MLDIVLLHIADQIINPPLNDIAQELMLLTAIFREENMLDASVCRIDFPLDKALLLQQIYRTRDHSLIQIKHIGKLILFRTLVIENTDKHDIFREGKM
jgi:hypothetical protein